MTEKKKRVGSKLKQFLDSGPADKDEKDEISEEEEKITETDTEEEKETVSEGEEYLDRAEPEDEDTEDEEENEEPSESEDAPACTVSPDEEIAELKAMVAALSSELRRYTTTKEQLKEYSAVLSKKDAELSNRKYIGLLEQLSAMREDFFKLSKGIGARLDDFSAKDVLSSFEAYGVDMENMLTDCGVFIGAFQYEKLNTIHQRIVDVIPTDDEDKNGMIAERISDGYEYNGRVLYKERVNIYKFAEGNEKESNREE